MKRTLLMALAALLTGLCAAAAQGAPDAGKGLVVARHEHVGVVVQDLAAEVAWYRKAFGLAQMADHQPTPDIRTILLRAPNGLQLELVQNLKSRRDHVFNSAMEATLVQGFGHWAVQVDDLSDAYPALIGAGATVGKPPADGPGGSRFAYIKDPEGNLIELIQLAGATQ